MSKLVMMASAAILVIAGSWSTDAATVKRTCQLVSKLERSQCERDLNRVKAPSLSAPSKTSTKPGNPPDDPKDPPDDPKDPPDDKGKGHCGGNCGNGKGNGGGNGTGNEGNGKGPGGDHGNGHGGKGR